MLGFLAGALAALALALPSSAFAGTYTWNLASNFTATGSGSNPDHDQYGGTPWTYEEGATTSALTRLPTFASDDTGAGGLAAWFDNGTGAFVGVNDTGSSITAGTDTFPPSQIAVAPESSGGLVAVGWTSPFSETQTVAVNGAVSADGAAAVMPPCTPSTTWSVVGANGASLPPESGTTPGSFSTAATVPAGATIYVEVSTPSTDSACDATGLSLQITAPGITPTLSVTQPSSGSSTTVSEPTFSGAASSDFGDSGEVTLRVYSGGAVSGSPVQTVVVPRSGQAWSATLSSPLALGTYTAQAEQDDIVGDQGFSTPVTFGVGRPPITLNPLGSTPLSTATPALTGMAGTESSDSPSVTVTIYAGTGATGSPVRTLTAAVGPSGLFSAAVTPALADGTYTAQATQGDAAGSVGVSSNVTFSIDTKAPHVTLSHPGKGTKADLLQLVFNGVAANNSFDSNVVTVTLYKGAKATGTPLGSVTGQVTGTTWSASWPGKLRPATYTVQASQADVLGHVGRSVAHTFRLVSLPPVIGVATFKGGRVSLTVACNEPLGDTCSGTLLAVTVGSFQPLPGGPIGPLTVMFAFVRVKGGQVTTIRRTLLPRVAAVLGRHASVAVTITANLHPLHGKAIRLTQREGLRRL